MTIKNVIQERYKKAERILNTSAMYDDDKRQILMILKLFAYNWCTANASACAMEEAAKQVMDEETYAKWLRMVVSDQGGVSTKKFNETYPFE